MPAFCLCKATQKAGTCYDENRDRNMCQLFASAKQCKKLAHVTESAESVTCASLLPLLCYAMLCYAMLCHAMPCHAMPCHAMLCYAMLCYAMLCYAMLRYAMLCYAMLGYAMRCYAMLCGSWGIAGRQLGEPSGAGCIAAYLRS